MEHAPLRPVAPRPEGPVEAGEALRHVSGYLPVLDPTAATALALVEVAGRPRPEAASEAEVSAEELAVALTRARKALRRSVQPLPGSGWCERAERYISDRLDDELRPPGPARLGVHLDNCPRCVEHELRLAQATEAMMRAFVETHFEPAPEARAEPSQAPLEAPAPELTVVPPAPPAPVTPRPEPEAAPAATAPPSAPKPSRGFAGWAAWLAWHGLFALAILLALLTIVLAVIGITGGEL